MTEAVAAHGHAVALQPAAAAAYNNLGLALEAAGAVMAARQAYGQALRLNPEHVDTLVNAGLVALRTGDPSAAAVLLERALAWEPADAALHHALGRARLDNGTPEAARRALRVAVLLAPEDAAARNDLGDALYRLGRRTLAEQRFRQALVLRAEFPEALNNLAMVCLENGAATTALGLTLRALVWAPEQAGVWAMLGRAALALGRVGEARMALRRAWRLAPGAAVTLTMLGVALARPEDGNGIKGEGEDDNGKRALACQRWAVALAPECVEAWSNLGLAEEALGSQPAAEEAYHRAVTLAPSQSQPRLNRGLLRLARGETAMGWADYRARFAAEQRTTLPLWQGESLRGRRLLVWREQGLGDEILFAATLPTLLARAATEGGTVVLECDPRLLSLFARSFPTATIRANIVEPQTEGCDCHSPAGALPGLLASPEGLPVMVGTQMEEPETGFLRADPERVAFWRARLAGCSPEPAIGLCWRSRLVSGNRSRAYRPLHDWHPLWSQPGAQFVSLQYDRDARWQNGDGGVPLIHWPDLDLTNALDDTAALIRALALVISAPTVIGEMAAALGVPVWRVGGGRDWTTLGSAVRPWLPCQQVLAPAPGEGLKTVLWRLGGRLRTLLADA